MAESIPFYVPKTKVIAHAETELAARYGLTAAHITDIKNVTLAAGVGALHVAFDGAREAAETRHDVFITEEYQPLPHGTVSALGMIAMDRQTAEAAAALAAIPPQALAA